MWFHIYFLNHFLVFKIHRDQVAGRYYEFLCDCIVYNVVYYKIYATNTLVVVRLE